MAFITNKEKTSEDKEITVLYQYLDEGEKNVIVPIEVRRIEPGAFADCETIETLLCPKNCYIGAGAFKGMTNLRKLTIGYLKHSVDSDCEWQCTFGYYFGHTEKEVKGTVLQSYRNTQRDEYRDVYYYIPSSLEEVIIQGGHIISGSAFKNCRNLKKIEIPEGVKKIDKEAFWCCSKLEELYIPSSVEEIDETAFIGCISLKSINVSVENKKFISSGNCLIEKETKTLIKGCDNSVIPIDGSVTHIGRCAFLCCKKLETILIPKSVQTIGKESFSKCLNLREFKFETDSELCSIGDWAFCGCKSLEEIEIPFRTTSIGMEAFKDCEFLKRIKLFEYIERIYEDTFSNCKKIEEVIFDGDVNHLRDKTEVNGNTEFLRALSNCRKKIEESREKNSDFNLVLRIEKLEHENEQLKKDIEFLKNNINLLMQHFMNNSNK